MHRLLYLVLLVVLVGCSTSSSNNDSIFPIVNEGVDSIKQVNSDLAFNRIHLGKAFSFDSIKPLRFIDTYYSHYNPENNNHIQGSFVTEIHSELNDFQDPDFNCKVYHGLNSDLVYKIEITINRPDTSIVNAYINKYGANNCKKGQHNHWSWEYKNQEIILWLMNDFTSIQYCDSINIKIHELEVDSIKKAYKSAILEYNKTIESKI